MRIATDGENSPNGENTRTGTVSAARPIIVDVGSGAGRAVRLMTSSSRGEDHHQGHLPFLVRLQFPALRGWPGVVRDGNLDDGRGPGLARPFAERRLGNSPGPRDRPAVHPDAVADPLRRKARGPLRQTPATDRREPGLRTARPGAVAAGVNRHGPAVAHLPVRTGPRSRERRRDADPDGIRERAGRRRTPPQRVGAERGVLQRRPGRRPGRRRPVDRRLRYRPGHDVQRRELPRDGGGSADDAPGRDAPRRAPGDLHPRRRRTAVRARPGGPGARAWTRRDDRAVRPELPAHRAPARQDGISCRRGGLRAAHQRARRRMPW